MPRQFVTWYHIYYSYYIHGRSSSLIGRQLINKRNVKSGLCENEDFLIMRLLLNGEVDGMPHATEIEPQKQSKK